MNNNNSYINLMIDSLEKKVSVLERITEVNERQKKIVTDSDFDMDALDATVEEKGKLVDEINKLDEGFESLYARVRDALQEDKAQYADKIVIMQKLIQRIVELTTSIEADEKRIKANVDSQFSKIKQTVKETRKNSKMVSNYYKNMSKLDTEPQFMDKKK